MRHWPSHPCRYYTETVLVTPVSTSKYIAGVLWGSIKHWHAGLFEGLSCIPFYLRALLPDMLMHVFCKAFGLPTLSLQALRVGLYDLYRKMALLSSTLFHPCPLFTPVGMVLVHSHAEINHMRSHAAMAHLQCNSSMQQWLLCKYTRWKITYTHTAVVNCVHKCRSIGTWRPTHKCPA